MLILQRSNLAIHSDVALSLYIYTLLKSQISFSALCFAVLFITMLILQISNLAIPNDFALSLIHSEVPHIISALCFAVLFITMLILQRSNLASPSDVALSL